MSLRRRLRIAAAAGVLTGLAFLGMTHFWIGRELTRAYSTPAEAPKRAVAIIPGAGLRPNGEPSQVLEDRLACGLALWRAQNIRWILVSGDHGHLDHDEIAAMSGWLRAQGVPPGVIIEDHAGFRTLDTMERAARVFAVHEAVVCTQAVHMARTLFLARRAGIDAVGVMADQRDYPGVYLLATRELLATGVAFIDSYVLGRGPRYLGPRLPIADATQAHP